MLDTERAWAAGFIDGEGCFSIQRGSRKYVRPLLTAAQLDPAPLLLLRGWFGGGVYTQRQREGLRPIVAWQCPSRAGILAAIEQLRPFLVVKADHADLMYEYLMGPGAPCGKGRNPTPEHIHLERAVYVARMSEMNHRARDISGRSFSPAYVADSQHGGQGKKRARPATSARSNGAG